MLDMMRVFVKVAETRSFSKTGRQLKMAPSSISRKIDNLETELGVTLIKRSTRQLVLTDKGVSFLEGAKKILPQVEGLIVSMQDASSEVTGTVKISCFESFGRIHICPLIPEFVSLYPEVKVELELENRMVDLAAEDADIAIRVGKPADSSLRARKLLSNHAVVCAAPEYLENYGAPENPDDLSNHNCLTLNQKRQQCFWFFSKDDQMKKVLIKGNISSTGGTPLLEAAEKGIGIIMLANWMVSKSLQEGTLRTILNDWTSSLHGDTNGEILAVFQNSKYMNPALRAFIDFLAEKISQ